MAGRVIITGFMGSGKTAVGKRLAQRTDMDFVDTDVLATEKMGISIRKAFAERGEEYFREVEEEAVRDALAAGARQRVVSLGGGAVTSAATRSLLEDEEAVIWLAVDVETAFRRSRGGSRPLARDRREFERLYQQRQSYYEAIARMKVDTSEMEIDEIVDAIIAFLGGAA